MMVEPDFAEFVDQHGDVGKIRRSQEPLQQRGFAAAEKSGDDVDRRQFAIIGHGAAFSLAANSTWRASPDSARRADRSLARRVAQRPARGRRSYRQSP